MCHGTCLSWKPTGFYRTSCGTPVTPHEPQQAPKTLFHSMTPCRISIRPSHGRPIPPLIRNMEYTRAILQMPWLPSASTGSSGEAIKLLEQVAASYDIANLFPKRHRLGPHSRIPRPIVAEWRRLPETEEASTISPHSSYEITEGSERGSASA